jgi:branched-chain amino acid transport system permease protein
MVFFHMLLPIFAAAIVGGIGQPLGAILGGYVVAFSEITATYAFKKFIKYVTPGDFVPDGLVQFLTTEYKFAVSFLILVLVLLVRPTGILRGKVL